MLVSSWSSCKTASILAAATSWAVRDRILRSGLPIAGGIRSTKAVSYTHLSTLTLSFDRLNAAEGDLSRIFSYFQFGDDDGTPYLDMGSSASSIKMRLTNSRLSFVQSGSEVAYFSDNKLFVTRLETVQQISIGTAYNGFLDIETTPLGVGFKWRS